MSTGTVIWWSREKHYGFIATDNGEDVFFHDVHCRDTDTAALSPGLRVEVEITQGARGKTARFVRPVS